MENSNIGEQQTNALAWRRCFDIHMSNPYNGVPFVQFTEEDVVEINGQIHQLGTRPHFYSVNPEDEIDLVDPATLETTGQKISVGAVYLALFSKYLELTRAWEASLQPLPPPNGEVVPPENGGSPAPDVMPQGMAFPVNSK